MASAEAKLGLGLGGGRAATIAAAKAAAAWASSSAMEEEGWEEGGGTRGRRKVRIRNQADTMIVTGLALSIH